jgi:LEA14-like dessication related protein
MRKIYFLKIAFLIIISFSLSSSNVLGEKLRTPEVSMVLQKVFVFPPGSSSDLSVKWIIHNPNDLMISLKYIYFKVYVNGKFVNEGAYFSEVEGELEKEWSIAPNQTKIIERTFTLEFPSDEEIKETILSGKGEWNFEGTAFFDSSIGEVNAPIITKKSTVKYEGYGFPLPKIEVSFSVIKVEVKDEKGLPLSGAKVILISKETRASFEETTNEMGSIEFKVPTINYILKVFKEGYFPREQFLEVSTPSTLTKVIQLYRSIKLTLEIKDQTGKPLSDANVTLSSKEVGNFSKATDTSGRVEFEIPRTNYTLSVVKKGYLPYEEVLDLSKSPIESKTIQLKPELTWLEQYWSYLIIGVIALCIIIVPIVLRLKRRY